MSPQDIKEGIKDGWDRIPKWVGMVLVALTSAGVGVGGAQQVGQTLWNQNNEPRFEALYDSNGKLWTEVLRLEREKVSRGERQEMKAELIATIQANDEDLEKHLERLRADIEQLRNILSPPRQYNREQ